MENNLIQIESSHTALDLFLSVVIFSCCDHNRSYWEKMWPIHQIISIYPSQTDYMAQNRDSYSQVTFRNLMKKWRVVFLVKKVLHWRNNKINCINCNINTIISFSFNIVFKLSIWNYHTQLNTKKVKINSEKICNNMCVFLYPFL